MYLTYTDYTTKGGTLDETAFNRLEFKAEKLIDQYTFGRLTELTTQSEAVQNLVFELIGLADKDDAAVTSVSNDGYSESYAAADFTIKSDNLIYSYLAREKTADGTPVLYRGVVT